MAAAYLNAPAVPHLLMRAYLNGYSRGYADAFDTGCTGKVRQSKGEAQATAQRRGGGSVYLCLVCDAWHTSHLDKGDSASVVCKARNRARKAAANE